MYQTQKQVSVSVSPVANDISLFLTRLALNKLQKIEEDNRVFVSKDSRKQHDLLNAKYNEIMEYIKHDEKLMNMFADYDEKVCYWQSLSYSDTFIQGFIEGHGTTLQPVDVWAKEEEK